MGEMDVARLDRIPVKAPQTAYQVLDEQAVVLDITAKILRGFNPVASRIWHLVDGRRTIKEIAVTIAEEFAGDEAEIVRDVDAFLHELTDKQLVVFSPAPIT
ncbi:MAG: PqqD family protein [Nitrospirota bacterium]